MITFEQLAGWSALVAAVATVVGAVFLVLFFSRGQPWGTLNDIASVVLMIATIPVAGLIATIEAERFATIAYLAAALGVAGMLAAAGFQSALVARLRTYEQLLPWTLGAGVVVGAWYILAGVLALPGGLPEPLPWLMILAGLGFVAIGYGFAAAGQRHPLAIVGGVSLLVASTIFFTLLGLRLLAGDLAIPTWNL